MKQVKINGILYVMDTEAYAITADTDASIIYVPEDYYDDYVAINSGLTLTKYNYGVIRVTKPEYDVPEPPTPTGDSRLIATYNVTDIGDEEESYPTQIYTYIDSPQYSVHGVDLFDKIEIDDVEVSVESLDENRGAYQFETTGEHTAKFTLKNPSALPPFFNCDELVGIIIPDSITSIGQAAFYQSNIQSITLPNSVTSIGEQAFYQTKLTTINIPNSVTSIGQAAFAYNSYLTSVTIGNGVETWGSRVFGDCTALTSVIINSPNIGERAFENCSALTSITLGNTVIEIEGSAFYPCTALTSVIIPSSVTNIGGSAFQACSSLTSVTIQATTPPTLSGYPFENNAEGRKIYVPSASVDAYKAAELWSSYANDILPIQ